jgi:uncharacterized protein YoxC
MDSIPGRVNDLEKEVHTLDHRVKSLEDLPVKVSELERSFSVMESNLEYIKSTGTATKKIVDELNNSQKTLIGELKGVPRAVNLVAGLIAIGGIGVSIVIYLQ